MDRSQTAIAAPIDKVAHSVYVGAGVAVGVWALRNYARVDVPPDVAAAVVVLLSGAVGYFTPLRSHEVKPR
jgi:hypothetical protein